MVESNLAAQLRVYSFVWAAVERRLGLVLADIVRYVGASPDGVCRPPSDLRRVADLLAEGADLSRSLRLMRTWRERAEQGCLEKLPLPWNTEALCFGFEGAPADVLSAYERAVKQRLLRGVPVAV